MKPFYLGTGLFEISEKTMEDPLVQFVVSHYYIGYAACIMLIMELKSCIYSI